MVRTQFFAAISITSVTFSYDYIRFSIACVRKFSTTEYIEMLVHPEKLLIAVRPCANNHKNAMRWAKIQDNEISIRMLSGNAFLKTLYTLFGWNPALKYRLRGEVLQHGMEVAIIFDVGIPEVSISRYNVQIPQTAEFGIDYYGYKSSQFHGTPFSDTFTEYNNEPDLQPTMPEIIKKNVQHLIKNIKIGEENCGNSADILY